MAFTVPSFNIQCGIYRNLGIGGTYGAPDVTTPAALSPAGHGYTPGHVLTGAGASPFTLMRLLLPKRTDIRAPWNGLNADVVEFPQTSFRFYAVVQVDDVARGYSNEYRFALLQYQISGNAALLGANSAPVPLP